jgi:hypothetical protein
MKIKLFNLRCGFAAFYRPGAFGDGDPAWQTALIIPPDHPAVAMLDKTILAVATEKWKTKAKAEAILKTMEGDRKRMCFHKKPYTNDEGTPYDGFDGAFYLRARNPDVQPLIVDRRGQEVGKGQDGAPYSGCYVNVEIDVWAAGQQLRQGDPRQAAGRPVREGRRRLHRRQRAVGRRRLREPRRWGAGGSRRTR